MGSGRNGSSFYDFVFTDLADPRTTDWFLMESPWPGLTIVGTYLLYVVAWGPRQMKYKKPMDLNSVLIVYNFMQVLMSVYLFYEAFFGAILREDYSLNCQPLIVEPTKEAMREARCIHSYFLAKIMELLDTVFFVLRKKTKQVSFLHVYHHAVMPIISWGYVKYCPGGHVVVAVALNSFVHIIMYTYYMLAACGPRLQKYLWWKKYITLLQMVQFLLMAVHNGQLLYTDCNYPKASLFVSVSNSLFFMYLFSDFYGKSYKGKKTVDHNSGAAAVKPHEN